MYLFGMGVVLLPMWIALAIVKIATVVFVSTIVVCLVSAIIGAIAVAIYFLFRNRIDSRSSASKTTTLVVLGSLPAILFLLLLSIGFSNAPDAAWCELVRGSHMEHASKDKCEKIDSAWFRWIYLPEMTRNTKAGTPEQEEAIRQSLPDQSSSP